MFFDNGFGLLRAVVVGILAYGGLLLFLRASGKRTLAKMNAFDLVVTVALGSTLATVLLTEDVALLEGWSASRCSSFCYWSSPGSPYARPWSGV